MLLFMFITRILKYIEMSDRRLVALAVRKMHNFFYLTSSLEMKHMDICSEVFQLLGTLPPSSLSCLRRNSCYQVITNIQRSRY